ncbi:UDP-galactose transporter senju isoform X1 [Hydra vulgaris]|uniref:UDP-galactose transporter senju isoform X1 n=1 Tax=Hydra vulgaris TaxID=6087 RepID=UPI000640CCB0
MPSLSDIKNLFPTKLHAVIFVGYMGLFISQGILITATKDNENNYPYNPTTLVLLSEFLKFFVSCGLHIKDVGVQSLFRDIVKHSNVLLLYMIPAFLYCLYNNLAFTNLRSYDPTTYFLLLQFRVVITGVIFQFLFNKKLSRTQWFSLILLTVGCIIKHLHLSKETGLPKISFTLNMSLLMILLQIFCSCFAGVYNEYLLKDKGDSAPFMLQNVFMYTDSVICNVLLLSYSGEIYNVFLKKNIDSVLHPIVLTVVLNNGAIGIVTAMFLKSLNSILKTFASALELMFTAILSWIIFGIPVNFMTIVAIGIVSFATLLYAKNPVDNTPKTTGLSKV